jgi:DNA primase
MPDEISGFIDFRAVKAAVTMQQVLEHYGLRERMRATGNSGENLTGCCPIHKGSNPTQFRVSLAKNCWNCFSSCRCGGNVLDFIAKMEEVPIQKAAQLAAEWFHVAIEPRSPARESTTRSAEHRKSDQEVQAECGTAGDQNRAQPQDPITGSTAAAPAEEENVPNEPLAFELKHLDAEHPYLSQRGLSPESIQLFGLGHCKKGILSGRIAIPIHNHSGQLVAYAGRWLGEPPAQKPKYQFPRGFRKSQEVFNLHRAKEQEAAVSPLFIVEGFFDCMKLWQAGVKRVVALMGSSLSLPQEEQILDLVGANGQIALLLDEDDAGISGRADALRRFASKAFVRVIELKDVARQPDELSDEQIRELLLQDGSPEYEVAPTKVALGRVVATPNALRRLTEFHIRTALARHARGDWGDLDEEDRAENELSLQNGSRLLSAYHTSSDLKFWIITEADRSATTILLPEDY